MDKTLRVTGPAVCPACQIAGSDADGCRANQLSDGRVYCILCRSISSPIGRDVYSIYRMPFPVRKFVATMLSEEDPQAPMLKLTMASFGPDGSSSQAAAACAQGNEGVILNAGSLILSADPHGLSRLEVRFQADGLQHLPESFGRADAPALDHGSRQFLRNLQLHSCPPALEAAIGKLISIGFTVRHTDFSGASMRRIQLHCGGNIEGTNVPKGIMVEATYLV